MSKEEILLNVVIAFFSGTLGAIASTVLAPFWRDYYSKQKELKHIKKSLRLYITYMDETLKVPFVYRQSSANGKDEYYSLAIIFADLEQSLSTYRFDKNIMLSEKDYKNILRYCYTQGISHLGLESQKKIYTELFLRNECDFI